MSSPHGSSNGDHSGSLKGLDAALLQSQLVCLAYICVSCCITMYRGTVRSPCALCCSWATSSLCFLLRPLPT